MGRRTQIDQPLAEALARGETLAKAAQAAGCALATAKRRWQEPGFRALVVQLQHDARRERQALLHATWHLGVQLVFPALRALQETLQDPQASHLDKARAARVLLRAYGPREEPPAPVVRTVEDEQQSAAMAEATRKLLAGMNVVDLDTRRPPPPRPAPAAGEASWAPPESGRARGVGQEFIEIGPEEPLGPPEPPPQAAGPMERRGRRRAGGGAGGRGRRRTRPPGPGQGSRASVGVAAGAPAAAAGRPGAGRVAAGPAGRRSGLGPVGSARAPPSAAAHVQLKEEVNMGRVPPNTKGIQSNPGALAKMQQRLHRLVSWSSRETATTATAGTSGAPPAQVAGYLLVEVVDATTGLGSKKKVPYYNN
jgi:hypothetical protein